MLTPIGDGNSASASSLAIQADRSLVAAGSAFDEGAYTFALARYQGA